MLLRTLLDGALDESLDQIILKRSRVTRRDAMERAQLSGMVTTCGPLVRS